MDTLALTQSTDTGVAASPAPSRRPNLVCFPLYRDRLACDPQNCLCVYESHEFKWGDTVTNSEQTIRSLVDAMVLSARRAFTNSLAYWRQLPVSVQRALALRSALALQPTALHTALAHVHPAPVASLSFYPVSSDTASGGQRMNHRKSIGNHLSGSVLDSSALAGGGGPRQNRFSVMGTSQTRRCMRERHEEETTMINAIVGLWEPPQNGPRCRIVIDIVASRKTIGEEPQNSEPYRLGQYIYRYIQEQYPADGMNVFVGITDCAMTLIGRDILFPYRITGNASGAGSSGRVGRLRNAGTIAAAATAESLIMSMPTGVAPSPMNLEHVLANIIPPPCAITTPATKTDKVDNVRLIVCYPSSNEGIV